MPMNSRQWISRARGLNHEIAMLEEALNNLRDEATKMTQNYESDGAQSSKDPHKLDKLGEFADTIREKKEALHAVQNEITEAIYRLNDTRHRTVLFEYYVNGISWEAVAAKMNYSWRMTMYLRKKALQEFDKLCIELHIDSVI